MSRFTCIEPNSIKKITHIYDYIDGYNVKQILYCIGRYSYIVGSEIDSGSTFTIKAGRAAHNLQIGQFCSIGKGVCFITGKNHNYKSVSMGVFELIDMSKQEFNGFCQKGSIIVQNDVWIGRNSTIMAGVIIRNGAVVAANSHVVNDVPPFAIVGGNPARILGYRFNEEIISMLQNIKWWNWTDAKITENAECFLLSIEEFCSRFYTDEIEHVNLLDGKCHGQYLYIMDFDDLYPCYTFVINQFINKFVDERKKLLLYIAVDDIEKYQHDIQEVEMLLNMIKSIPDIKLTIELIMEEVDHEKLMAQSEYYITNRRKETVLLTEYADKYNVKIISGVENNIFEEHMGFV